MQINYFSESQVSIKGVSGNEIRIRASGSKVRNTQAQVEALKAAGCERTFSEKASGNPTDGRPGLPSCRDAVVVTKLDRLARSSGVSCTNWTASLWASDKPRGKLVRHHD